MTPRPKITLSNIRYTFLILHTSKQKSQERANSVTPIPEHHDFLSGILNVLTSLMLSNETDLSEIKIMLK